jgi:hypothetical protein
MIVSNEYKSPQPVPVYVSRGQRET